MWHSGIKQLEVGASGEKQRNAWAVIPLQSIFPPRTSCPHGVQAAADPMGLFGSGGFCSSLGPSIVSGRAEESSLIFTEVLLLSVEDLTSLSSSWNSLQGPPSLSLARVQ